MRCWRSLPRASRFVFRDGWQPFNALTHGACAVLKVEMSKPLPNHASSPRAEPPVAGLYREHFRFIWRGLRRLGVHESSLDDAVQEVFLIAHRKLPEFEGRSSHRVWLFAIALRVAREHRRRNGRLQFDDEAVTRFRAEGKDVVALRARVRLLDTLLATLSDEQREVFVMTEIEGFSAPELASALELNLNTVYSRLRLARARFDRALARQRRRDAEGGA
jgi:RNA polymerase sigma-70 factor (ECF subfamily)